MLENGLCVLINYNNNRIRIASPLSILYHCIRIACINYYYYYYSCYNMGAFAYNQKVFCNSYSAQPPPMMTATAIATTMGLRHTIHIFGPVLSTWFPLLTSSVYFFLLLELFVVRLGGIMTWSWPQLRLVCPCPVHTASWSQYSYCVKF